MKNVFNENHFNDYKKRDLNESMCYVKFSSKITVFISHKHSDLEQLKDFIGFLEQEFNVDCYIDGMDSAMPAITSGETADRIKKKIKDCNKFILLATSDAVESKWCNWELGFGDSEKLINKNLAILPMKLDNDSSYKGNEYLEIYPHIVKQNYGDKYTDGSQIEHGYYVRYKSGSKYYITKLSEWLK